MLTLISLSHGYQQGWRSRDRSRDQIFVVLVLVLVSVFMSSLGLESRTPEVLVSTLKNGLETKWKI